MFAAGGPCGPADPGRRADEWRHLYPHCLEHRGWGPPRISLKIFQVVPQHFNIAIGQVVNTNTAAGAGNIETPGAQDIYTFQATAGETVYFDAQSGSTAQRPSSGAVLMPQERSCSTRCLPLAVRAGPQIRDAVRRTEHLYPHCLEHRGWDRHVSV